MATPSALAFRAVVVETAVAGRLRTINTVRDAAEVLLTGRPEARRRLAHRLQGRPCRPRRDPRTRDGPQGVRPGRDGGRDLREGGRRAAVRRYVLVVPSERGA